MTPFAAAHVIWHAVADRMRLQKTPRSIAGRRPAGMAQTRAWRGAMKIQRQTQRDSHPDHQSDVNRSIVETRFRPKLESALARQP